MFGAFIRPTLRNVAGFAVKRFQKPSTLEIGRKFSQLTIQPAKLINLKSDGIKSPIISILNNPGFLKLTANPAVSQVRTVTKFSMGSGKRKSVKTILRRFYRLDWGIWIRTKTGRHKKLWKKSKRLQRRLRQHVFCNSTQSNMLDKMVTARWRKRKYFVDDPYSHYHERETFWATRKKPIEWDY